MPAVMPSALASGSTISTRRRRHDVGGPPGVAVPVDQRLRLGPDLVEQLRDDLGVEGDEVVDAHALDGAEDAIAHTASTVSSLAPRNLKRDGTDRVAPNWPGGTSPARHAATPSTNADEPVISVRSRSKNAALGPVVTYCVTAG